ncbi:hypothetical protein BV129_01324 [Haemophilus influenzae]|nr:hypothetical protein BV129_01324 [Haemophilus influenzae]
MNSLVQSINAHLILLLMALIHLTLCLSLHARYYDLQSHQLITLCCNLQMPQVVLVHELNLNASLQQIRLLIIQRVLQLNQNKWLIIILRSLCLIQRKQIYRLQPILLVNLMLMQVHQFESILPLQPLMHLKFQHKQALIDLINRNG